MSVKVPAAVVRVSKNNCDSKLWMQRCIHFCFFGSVISLPRTSILLFLNDGTWPWFLTARIIFIGYLLLDSLDQLLVQLV